MKIRSLLTLVGLVIRFAVPVLAQQKDTADPRMVQQRDLLGVAKALGEFGVLGIKVGRGIQQERRQRRCRAFHGGRGFGGTGRDVLRSAGHREKVCRHVPPVAYHHL